jgi:hypothetical protein
VKAIKRVLGILDDCVAKGRARAGAEVDHALRHARLFQHLDELGGNGRRIARGLQNHRVARNDRRRRHPRHNGKRKVPRRNHRAHTQRNVDQLIALAGILDGRFCPPAAAPRAHRTPENRSSRPHRRRPRPSSCPPQGEPGHELELALPDNLRRMQQERNTIFRRNPAPKIKRLERSGHCLFRVLWTGLLVHAHHLRRLCRIEGTNLVSGLQSLSAYDQVVFAPKVGRHLFERALHCARILRRFEI